MDFPSRCPRLPQELFALISNELVGDNDSLRAFSLVCRSLQSEFQKHLLSSVKLITNEDATQFCGILENNPVISTYVTKLTATEQHLSLAGLGPPLSSVLLQIRKNFTYHHSFTLAFVHSHQEYFLESVYQQHIEDSLHMICLSIVDSLEVTGVRGFPRSIISSSTRLSEIMFKSVTFFPGWKSASRDCLDYMSMGLCQFVKRIHLIDVCSFPTEFISSCANLTELAISGSRLTCWQAKFEGLQNDTYYRPPCYSRPKIKKLELGPCKNRVVRMLVDDTIDVTELYELSDYTAQGRGYNEDVVDLCRNSLERLVTLSAPVQLRAPEDTIYDLSTFPNLRETKFVSYTGTPFFSDQFSAVYIRTLMASIPLEKLGRARISYYAHPEVSYSIRQVPEWENIFKLISVLSKPDEVVHNEELSIQIHVYRTQAGSGFDYLY